MGIYSETNYFIEGWQFCGSFNESQTNCEGGLIATIFLEVEWSRYWAEVSYVAYMDWRAVYDIWCGKYYFVVWIKCKKFEFYVSFFLQEEQVFKLMVWNFQVKISHLSPCVGPLKPSLVVVV